MKSSLLGLVESRPDSVVLVRLELPREVFETYEAQSAASGREVEEELSTRLMRCREHTASQCIYLNDSDRQQLGVLVGRSISTPAQLLNAVRNTMAVRCGTIKGELSRRHLDRLTPRAKAEHRAPEEVGWREMLRGLEEFLGMR